ncbi:hypothetical protein Vafri_10839 [Volvox africanus]|uniref:Uncharacterized protein n=1 Tax=Volvox africanus TaxID=51714 RepID=A0A8J4F0V4_9CHLO|nr:hypothetical protein Vafri_10839 [Volvox africanus]
MVDAADVVSVSASASETTSPGGSAAAGSSAGGAIAVTAAAAVAPMDVDASSVRFGSAATSASAAAMAHLGLGLEVLLDAAARHRAPELRELVVGMLPGLLRLQDVAGPELQKFANEFQAALLVVRCLSLNSLTDTTATSITSSSGATTSSDRGPMLVAAMDALSAAAVVEVPWGARAAALSYAQMFWFRHAPLLSPQQLRHLQVGSCLT